MNQLSPSEVFPIVRVLENPAITDTFYVRAVIRDATTDVLLATVNLTDRGNRRFSNTWKVVYDNVNARGRFIVITTSVYSDAGYTTRSEVYGDVAETYVIQERFNNHAQFGGSGGVDIDYEKIRKMMNAMLDEKLKPLTELEPVVFPEAPTPKDYTNEFNQLFSMVESLPQPEKVDLEPIHRHLTVIENDVMTLPRFEPTDLTPVTSEIQIVGGLVKAMDTQHQIDMTTMQEMQARSNEENAKLSEFTNGNGSKMQLKVSDTEQSKRELILRRLALKHGL